MGKLYVQDTVIDDNDNEWLAKNKEYLNYIAEHIDNVDKAYKQLFGPRFTEADAAELQLPLGELAKARLDVRSVLDDHDQSKYSDEEFDAYRARFHKTTKEQEKYDNDLAYKETVDNNFQKAWEHHYKNNNHHPQWWRWVDLENNRYKPRETERSEALEMTLVAIFHMLCDWQAMSIKFNSKLSDWYRDEAQTDECTFMHPNTKAIVDRFVDWIKNHKE